MNPETPIAPPSETAPPELTTPATPATPVETPPPSPPPVPPVVETPPATPAIGPDGSLGENWFLSLGDEFAPYAKDLAKHKDVRSLITELNYFRKNGVEYPGVDAPSQAVERFRKAAGVPETAAGYGLTAENAKLPAGMEFDPELSAVVAEAALKTHTPPAALAAIVGGFNEYMGKRMEDHQAAAVAEQKSIQDALVAEWRGDFQTNASTVRHLTGKLAEQAGLLPDDPSIATMCNNPAFARVMLQVAKLTSEDRIQTPSGFGDLKSPAQRIAEIKSGVDPTWGKKWTQGTNAEKAAAYEYVKALSEQAKQ